MQSLVGHRIKNFYRNIRFCEILGYECYNYYIALDNNNFFTLDKNMDCVVINKSDLILAEVYYNANWITFDKIKPLYSNIPIKDIVVIGNKKYEYCDENDAEFYIAILLENNELFREVSLPVGPRIFNYDLNRIINENEENIFSTITKHKII